MATAHTRFEHLDICHFNLQSLECPETKPPDQGVIGVTCGWIYLTVSTLKLPSAREKPWFSVRGSPNPNVRTESVSVRRRAMTKSNAHKVNLAR